MDNRTTSEAEPLIDTHTVAAFEVRPETFAEIAGILRHLGLDSRFHPTDRGVLIDMTGLALIAKHDPTVKA